jgi:hypothetical protein
MKDNTSVGKCFFMALNVGKFLSKQEKIITPPHEQFGLITTPPLGTFFYPSAFALSCAEIG